LQNDKVHIGDPVQKTQAAPNVFKKQTVDPAVANGDTIVGSAVTVYTRGGQIAARGTTVARRSIQENLQI